MRGDPEKVYECVCKAFEAAADGIGSREYEEVGVSDLRADGRAMRSLG